MYSHTMNRTKSDADMLFDRMRLEQQKNDQLAAVQFLENTLDCSLSNENLHTELKNGVLLCKCVTMPVISVKLRIKRLLTPTQSCQ